MIIPDFQQILHGGDYNPDQWLREPEKIDEDFRLMDKAGCNTFSIGIFSWSQYELEEGKFDFSWLDMIMDKCQKHGKKVFLATPSAGRPAWLGRNYPETCRVNYNGLRERWELRANFCYSSPKMRERLGIIIDLLGERYANHPALAGWHIGNEYHGDCFCPLCLGEFAKFLEKRYGTLENFNAANWSEFWGHKASQWSDIDPRDWCMDGHELNWRRFNTAQIVDFMKFELAHVRKFSDKPSTTNMMSFFPTIDYWKLNEVCDFVCDDTYPLWSKPDVLHEAAKYAMSHDMHYSMQKKPFLIMESCPGVPNYYFPASMRRDNELEREMLLALGHGADGTLYFQWRKGRNNTEKMHGAVVGHDGGTQTRVFKSVADYGQRIGKLSELVDSSISAKAAVIFDWESLWALSRTKAYGGDGEQHCEETIVRHYEALWNYNVSMAVIDSDQDFSPYKLLVAPMLFMLKAGVAERMKKFVADGGTLVMSYLSGYVDENNLCYEGGFPGDGLRELFGVFNEDIDLFRPEIKRTLSLQDFSLGKQKTFDVVKRSELLHLEGATSWANYNEEFFAGTAAISCNSFGKGKAIYIGGETGQDFLDLLYAKIAKESGVEPVLSGMPDSVRVSKRSKDGKDYYFLLNMTPEKVTVVLPTAMDDVWHSIANIKSVEIAPRGGTVLRKA